jgi:hypothetical protein
MIAASHTASTGTMHATAAVFAVLCFSGPGFLRAAGRRKRNVNVQFDSLGFRVARSLNQ